MNGAPLMALHGIFRRYNGRVALELPALEVYAGEILGVQGPNGGGKSTLLRLMALLDAPDQGQVLFAGQPADIGNLALRRQICMLLQTPYLLSRTVEGNIAYGLSVRGQRDPRRVLDALAAVGLDTAFLTRRRFELSGGEAQRVALAARLALDPRLLLMDEPTASVDEESAERIADAARHLAARGAGVVIVSHDRDWLEPLATRRITLRRGRLVVNGQ